MKKIFIFTIFLILGLNILSLGESLALTISPAKIILSADPGETFEAVMRVRNDLERTVTHISSVERYTVRGGEEPIFYPEGFGLPTWIEVPAELTLGPGESVEVPVKIRVPEDASPGGHYAVIFWATAPPKGEGAVGIVTKVGALVLLEVSGEVIESAEISDFKAQKKFFTHLPIGFSFTLKNTGNVHLMPLGEVIIKNIFGKTLAILKVNPGQYHALPDTTRTFTTANWEPEGGMPKIEGKGFFAELKREKAGFAFGYYKADLNIEYGKERKTAQASFGFWVLPWRILLIAILILAVILLIFTKGISVYNRWIIAKARQS